MSQLSKRLAKLEAGTYERSADPRLAWPAWQGRSGERASVLALVDYVADWGAEFALFGSPASTPGFHALPELSQALLSALFALWGSSRRFPSIIAGFVRWEVELVSPLWAIEALITRAQMRRRFPKLLAQFEAFGDPTYSSHWTFRAEHWPERQRWTMAERAYLSKRFFDWDQRPIRRIAFLAAQAAGSTGRRAN